MSNISGVIFDIKKYSIHDGPGIRTTVFFKGCRLRCWWCHNPESQLLKPNLMLRDNRCLLCGACEQACSEGAIYGGMDVGFDEPSFRTDRVKCVVCGKCTEVCFSGARELVGRRVAAGEVIAEIERERPFYDQSGGGVTFSGGEPLLQPAFLLALLHSCREIDIHTALDTSGYAPWRVLEQVMPLVDLFLYDLKLMNELRHRMYTGVSNRLILRNLRMLSAAGANLTVRIPLIPGVNSDEENLQMAGKYLSNLPNLTGVDVIPYHASAEAKYDALGIRYQMANLQPPTSGELVRAVQVLKSFGLPVSSQSLVQKAIEEVFDDDQHACENLAPAVVANS